MAVVVSFLAQFGRFLGPPISPKDITSFTFSIYDIAAVVQCAVHQDGNYRGLSWVISALLGVCKVSASYYSKYTITVQASIVILNYPAE